MKRINYKLLTDYLLACDKDELVLTFSEIEDVLESKLPPSSRKHRANWSNNEHEMLAKAWRAAGYRSFKVSLKDETAHFRKVGVEVTSLPKRSVKESKKENKRMLITNAKDIILSDVPEKLRNLELDEFFLVKLNKYNSNIIEGALKEDPQYNKNIAKNAFDKSIKDNDFSKEAYEEIIRGIASENSTRTPKKSISLLAIYLSDPKNDFLNRLNEGNPKLVDDIVFYLNKNHVRKDKSLASKICRYLNEWMFHKDDYTINDSIVRQVLPYYIVYYYGDEGFIEAWLLKEDDLTYVEFFNIFEKVRSKVPELNRHELDHLLWYSYKNDNVRRAIASSLAEGNIILKRNT